MPSLPVVLAHGYLGFGTLGPFSYFNNVAKVLAQAGASAVYATDVAPKGSIAERSAQLAAQIRQYVPSGKVHLIAHSMGGLDARYLIGKANGSELIASLTTLGTPFRGTYVADVAADPCRLRDCGAGKILEAIARFQIAGLGLWPFSVPAQVSFAVTQLKDAIGGIATADYSRAASYFSGLLSLDDSALRELTTEKSAQLFPADESDLKGVPASSYAGCVEAAAVSPLLSAGAILLDATGQPNDGLVPVESAKLRNHKGTLQVDHLGLVGWGAADVSNCYREICKSY